MIHRLLAAAAGVFISLVILIFLDPFVPLNGMRVKTKSGDAPPEQVQTLKDLMAEPKWRDFLPPAIPLNAKIAESKRIQGGHANSNSKLSQVVTGANARTTDSTSVRLEGETSFRTIYDSVYTTDEFSRRTTAGQNGTSRRSFIFLGCSFTWGAGVSDDETFSSVVARSVAGSSVYNLGYQAFGPNDMIDDLIKNPQKLTGIKKGKGFAVYSMIGDHIERSLCRATCYVDERRYVRYPSSRVQSDRITKSRYVLKNGTLVNAGPFSQRNSAVDVAKQLLFQSRILSHLYFEFNSKWSHDDLFLFGKIVERLKDEIQSRTGFEFYLAFFPNHEIYGHEEFKAILDSLEIKYLDYSSLRWNALLNRRASHFYDQHPSKLGHEAYARLLIQDLKRRSPKQFED